jgi:sugar transferase (PEP-CTERM system associated)
MGTHAPRALGVLALDTGLIFGAVWAAAIVCVGVAQAERIMTANDGLMNTFVIALVCQLCLYFSDLYDLRSVADRRELMVRALQALSGASVILAALYYLFPTLVIARNVFLVAALLVITSVLGWRVVFEWSARRFGVRERLLLIGTTPAAIVLARELFERRAELGVDIVGFVDPDPARVGTPLINPGIIGTIADTPSIVRARSVDRVVVSLADARGTLPMDTLLEMKLNGIRFDHLASVYEQYTGKIAVENLRPSWFIFSPGFRKTALLSAGKRLADLITSAVGLLLASPLILLLAALVRLTSPGPAFYAQRRVGRYGRVFTIHKLRSMRADAEAQSGAVWATSADARITPLGRLLRRTRLDELPQLWNVLVGDMSLVGPRPERPEFVQMLTREIPFYGQRHVVRPGLTGWAQVRYTYGASVEDAMQKLQYDLFYIKHMSIALDLLILFSTIKIVILRRGAA